MASADELVTESRDVSDFHGIAISGSGQVNVSRSARESLSIEAPAATIGHIVTEVEGGILKIYKEKGNWNLRGPIRIELTYMTLDELNLSGSADVRTDTIVGESFEVRIRGSSNVEVAGFELDTLSVSVSGSGDLEVEELVSEDLEISVSGSGDVDIAGGRVSAQIVSVRGSGNVDIVNLQSLDAEATVSGSGDIRLQVTETLKATISGSGDISYRGTPVLESRVSGSGRLHSE